MLLPGGPPTLSGAAEAAGWVQTGGMLPGGPPALSGAAEAADWVQTGGGTAVGSGGQPIGQAAAAPGWRPIGAGPVLL